ncbi:MAG: exodeoxyribonuclease VII large subunit [Patescibacteria group bacterium]|jgi:exodeoxyribonuclease VII large subunit|nr:exodeoxyribonuclease VII large subunit [Patescibacteria group bacterium]
MSEQEKNIKQITVSDYLDSLNNGLRNFSARIIGEVSGLKILEGKGYLFFSIKDKEANAVLSCIMWTSQYRLSGVILEDGLEIIVSGVPQIYKPGGRLTFHAETIELVGEGALKIAYEKLKAQLQVEGLFEVSRKRAIPQFVQRIGLITSNNGAAKGDFLSNLRKSGFKITMIDSRVEGQSAVEELYGSIKTFINVNIDILVIIRGGGSLESLLPFNNEILAREIANFPCPVIVGVGHERDISLLGLVADKMVSTPTAAANILNDSWEKASYRLEIYKQKIIDVFQDAIWRKKNFINNSYSNMRDRFRSIFDSFKKAEQAIGKLSASIKMRIQEVKRIINQYPVLYGRRFEDRLKLIYKRVNLALLPTFIQMEYSIKKKKTKISLDNPIRIIINKIKQLKQKIISFEKILNTSNPERQLKLGYSIVRSRGSIVKKLNQIKKGDFVDVTIYDGNFKSEVKNINLT